MTVRPWRSTTTVLGLAVISLEMLVILPLSMRMDWSSRGAAPVPSIMRTWVSRTCGALTLTYFATAGEKRAGIGVAAGVCAGTVVKARGSARATALARRRVMGFLRWGCVYPKNSL